MIKLPKNGAEQIAVGSESAADIKTLTARLLELPKMQDDIPSLCQNPFPSEDADHQVERELAGASTFGCKVPNVIEAKLDKLAKDIADIKQAAFFPQGPFNFATPLPSNKTPSYALAASKHALSTAKYSRAHTQSQLRPKIQKQTTQATPTGLRPTNIFTLAQ